MIQWMDPKNLDVSNMYCDGPLTRTEMVIGVL